MKARIKKGISFLLAAVLMISMITASGNIKPKQVQAAEKFQIHFIDVGAGDAALLQYGEGSSAKYALIDAGPDYYTRTNGSTVDTSERVYNYLTEHHITKLEFVLLTHPHRDHIAGLVRVLKEKDQKIEVDKIYGNSLDLIYSSSGNQDPDDIEDTEFSSKVYEEVKEAIKERVDAGETEYEVPAAGSSIYLGSAKITFYGPLNMDFTYGRKVDLNIRQENKYSIVCKVEYGKNSFLMTGDAQKETIQQIVSKGYNLSAQVLKVPHHGMQDVVESNKVGDWTSDHKYLFDKVNAPISVVSNGYDNKNKSPKAKTLRDLEKSDVYLTSNRGTIIVSSDGTNLSVQTEKGNNAPSYAGDYNPAKKASPTMKSVSVSTNGKNKLVPTTYGAANSYKLYEKKNVTVKFSGTPQPFTKVKSVQYKFVKKGVDNRTVPYRNGSSAAVKNGSAGRIYVKYNTWLGSTVIKLPGFTVDTSAPSSAKIKGSKSGIKTYKTSSKNRYNKKYKKSIKLTFSASYGTSGKSKVQYKVVPRGKKNTKYKWKTGNSVTYKTKKKWVRVYVKFTDKSGNTTTRKTNGFYIKK